MNDYYPMSQRKVFSFLNDNLFILQEEKIGDMKSYKVWNILIIMKNINRR